MGGCQNVGPLLGALNTRCRILLGIQNGTIILRTTHVLLEGVYWANLFGGSYASIEASAVLSGIPWSALRLSWAAPLGRSLARLMERRSRVGHGPEALHKDSRSSSYRHPEGTQRAQYCLMNLMNEHASNYLYDFCYYICIYTWIPNMI